MDALAIKEFISIYQYAVFSQVRAIFDSLEPSDKDDFPETLIRYNRSLTGENEERGLFAELVENSNLANVVQVLSYFYFIKPLYLEDRFILFGRDNDRFYIGFDLVNRKVILFDDMDGLYTYIADSEGGFFDYLRIYLEYEIMPNELKNDYKVRLMFRERVIAAVGGEEYNDYYRFVFPGHQNEEIVNITFPFKL